MNCERCSISFGDERSDTDRKASTRRRGSRPCAAGRQRSRLASPHRSRTRRPGRSGVRVRSRCMSVARPVRTARESRTRRPARSASLHQRSRGSVVSCGCARWTQLAGSPGVGARRRASPEIRRQKGQLLSINGEAIERSSGFCLIASAGRRSSYRAGLAAVSLVIRRRSTADQPPRTHVRGACGTCAGCESRGACCARSRGRSRPLFRLRCRSRSHKTARARP